MIDFLYNYQKIFLYNFNIVFNLSIIEDFFKWVSFIFI